MDVDKISAQFLKYDILNLMVAAKIVLYVMILKPYISAAKVSYIV